MMQSYLDLNIPKDIIGLLTQKLTITDFSTAIDTLESLRNNPRIHNLILLSITEFLTNTSNKYPLKAEYLHSFPNLEIVKPQISGNVNEFNGLAGQPKLRSFNFLINDLGPRHLIKFNTVIRLSINFYKSIV